MLPFFVLIPFAAAILISLFNKLPRYFFDSAAILSTLTLSVISFLSLNNIINKGIITYQSGGLIPFLGLNMVADGLSIFMLITVNIISFLMVLYSTAYMEKKAKQKSSYYIFLMLLIAGLNGVLISSDLFNLYIFTEITLISAYILVAFNKDSQHYEASFKYTVLGTLSSLLILLAIAFIYSKTASLNFSYISLNWDQGKSVFNTFVILLLLAGFGLKTALVPFHTWLPDAHPAAPAPVSAMLSGLVIKTTGAYALIRIIFNVIGFNNVISNVLMYMGIVSIIVGILLALAQWDFKRLLAYSSVSQVGYIILGFGLGTPLGILGGLLHLINHSVFKSLLFLNAGSVEYSTGTRDIRELGGLSKNMPVTSFSSMIASLSIAGVPPLGGFWSKLLIIIACLSAGRYYFAVFAAVAGILTLALVLEVQKKVFYGYPNAIWTNIKECPMMMAVPMLILSVLCIFLGLLILPGFDNKFIGLALNTLLQGKGYAVSVIEMVK